MAFALLHHLWLHALLQTLGQTTVSTIVACAHVDDACSIAFRTNIIALIEDAGLEKVSAAVAAIGAIVLADCLIATNQAVVSRQ